jgi:restriction endonuclease S subunit
MIDICLVTLLIVVVVILVTMDLYSDYHYEKYYKPKPETFNEEDRERFRVNINNAYGGNRWGYGGYWPYYYGYYGYNDYYPYYYPWSYYSPLWWGW